MKNNLFRVLWLIIFFTALYFAYKTGMEIYKIIGADNIKLYIVMIIGVLLAGFSFGAIIFGWINTSTSNSLNMYKRELERESIDKTESSSRIKVLESKIQVLEKALDEALKK